MTTQFQASIYQLLDHLKFENGPASDPNYGGATKHRPTGETVAVLEEWVRNEKVITVNGDGSIELN